MRSSIIEYTLAVFLIIATTVLILYVIPKSHVISAETPAQGLPFGYNYKFIEIEGMNCILVTNFALPEGIAIDCDWRK